MNACIVAQESHLLPVVVARSWLQVCPLSQTHTHSLYLMFHIASWRKSLQLKEATAALALASLTNRVRQK